MPYAEKIFELACKRNPGEPEFLQAVKEVLDTLKLTLKQHPKYEKASILERMIEPERAFTFRVPWVDDEGRVQVNRGFRVQFSSAIGPYKGGLRFHPTVNISILKFLGFEQVFKNALTSLPMGGGKGGSDFDPKGKSDEEVMRFCQSFMNEFYRHIGSNTDIPAGDIGVGAREIGFLFGQYKRLANEFTGVITGKKVAWGGSLIRPEATGYGCVYFAKNMLQTRDETLEGKKCLVSGAGNVAQYTAEKLIQLGAKCITLSDSSGFIHDPDGLDEEKLAFVADLKNVQRKRISQYVEKYPSATYHKGQRPWDVPCDCAFPSATQNEIDGKDARSLIENGCYLVCEGANMPSDSDAIGQFLEKGILYGPGKAANAGGVAVSGLEMAQNAQHVTWERDEVEARLQIIMHSIHDTARQVAEEHGCPGNYVVGSNVAAFIKVADAMLDQGLV